MFTGSAWPDSPASFCPTVCSHVQAAEAIAARAVEAGAASLAAMLPAELAAQLPPELHRSAAPEPPAGQVDAPVLDAYAAPPVAPATLATNQAGAHLDARALCTLQTYKAVLFLASALWQCAAPEFTLVFYFMQYV